jgi:hypothetical protein
LRVWGADEQVVSGEGAAISDRLPVACQRLTGLRLARVDVQ